MRKLVVILGMCAATCLSVASLHAQDTITFTWKGGVNKQFKLNNNPSEQFTVYWGDGSIETILGVMSGQYQSHTYADTNNYIVSIIGGSSADFFTVFNCSNNQLSNLDVSKNTTLKSLNCSNNQLSNLDLSKNTALLELNCSNNQLSSLDLSKNTVLEYFLYCSGNQLSSLDLSKNTALWKLNCSGNQLGSLDLSKNTALQELNCTNNQLSSLNLTIMPYLQYLYCNHNQLSLSDLHAVSVPASITNDKRLGPQFLPARQIIIGDAIDFSSQKTFDNIATVFVVEKGYMGGTKAVLDVDYTFKNEIMAFKNTGTYFVNMTNTAIKSNQNYPAIVYAEFNVVEPPNTDATLASLTVSEGVLNPIFDCYTFNYAVDVANSVNSITITATANDTNAKVSGDIGLQQLKTGMNIFTIIVTAEDGKTKFNYTVAVKRGEVGIEKITQEQLIINSIEIYDVLGRKTSPNPSKGGKLAPSLLERAGGEAVLDISHLTNGIYFMKITTDKGIIIKKIIK